jgi:eukaryotic-like serine/threonine-protein kinase
MIESGSGNQEAAMQAFRRSLELDPASAATYIEMGSAAEAMGRATEAEKAYLRAGELHPGDWSSLNYLALYYYRHGRSADAVPLFLRGIEAAPDNNSLFTNLGAAYWVAGHLDDAARTWERSLALRPTASAYSNLGTAYFFQGRCRDAAPLMAKAVELQPKDNDLWANLADAQACAGSMEAARDSYRHALDLATERLAVNPRDAELISGIGLYQARLGQSAGSLPNLERARALAPSAREVQWRSAVGFELCGRRGPALDALAEAVRLGQPLIEVRGEPALAALRADPRYGSILSTLSAKR